MREKERTDFRTNQGLTQPLESYLPFVKAVSRRFIGRGSEFSDILQAGAEGLIKASISFDPDKGNSFEAYAFKFIEGSIREFIRKDHTVALPNRLIKQLAETRELKRSEGSTHRAEAYGFVNVLSLDDEIGSRIGDGSGLENSIVLRCEIENCIRALPKMEIILIRLRFFHYLTQKQTACMLGISQSAVSKLESKALSALKAMLNEASNE